MLHFLLAFAALEASILQRQIFVEESNNSVAVCILLGSVTVKVVNFTITPNENGDATGKK